MDIKKERELVSLIRDLRGLRPPSLVCWLGCLLGYACPSGWWWREKGRIGFNSTGFTRAHAPPEVNKWTFR